MARTRLRSQVEASYAAGSADGFNLMVPLLLADWLNFARLVVREPQRRTQTPKEYASWLLRDHLGLPRPPNHSTRNARVQQNGAMCHDWSTSGRL